MVLRRFDPSNILGGGKKAEKSWFWPLKIHRKLQSDATQCEKYLSAFSP
jgi:hypothetical protein